MKQIILFLCLCTSIGAAFAQDDAVLKEFSQSPKAGEKVIGVCSTKHYGGLYSRSQNLWYSQKTYTPVEIFRELSKKAQEEYGEEFPNFTLRNFKNTELWEGEHKYFMGSATVVIPDPKAQADAHLSSCVDKAFRNVRLGSRLAIDQIVLNNGADRNEYQDRVIDMLLDKGYKVVAKEYLEKLCNEQQNQQSGIYNDNTTVQENNFSAIGYYVNVKISETSLRVQVINVSTGEYEGNAIIQF